MKPNPRLVTPLFFLVPALLAMAMLTETLLIPSDPKNTIFLGLSTSRLALAGFLFVATLLFAILTGFSWKYPVRTRAWITDQLRKKPVFVSAWIVSFLLLTITYAILAIPDRYLHAYQAIHERARPFLTWLCITSFQGILGLVTWSVAQNPRVRENSDMTIPYKKILGIGVAVLAGMVGVWIFIGITRIGVWPGNAFWGKAGVPVLWPQILLAVSISIAIQSFLLNRLKLTGEKLWLDAGIGTALWLAAFLLWSNQSYIPGVFNTPPRPPAYQIFPSNDSQTYDLAAQNLLIGTPSTAMTIDKPLYIAFLAILHLLVGSNYSNLYLLQVAIFALIPVIGYFLGKSLHSRQLGIMFAVILVFREQNAIALTNIIQVSTAKMMLSEVLAGLGVLLLTLFLVEWLKHPDPMRAQLWMAGGVLGLTGLVRLNALTIAPLALLAIGLALKFTLKRWIIASVLFVVFLGIGLIPWSVESFRTTNDPLAFIKGKTNGVIIDNRYTPVITRNLPVPAEAPKPEVPSNEKPVEQPQNNQIAKYLLLGRKISEHYIHNLISMMIMLPPSGALYQPADMAIRLPYWKLHWDGVLQPDAYLILFMVLSFFSLGISAAWVRLKAAGIAPLLVVLGYDISTALALTSGGRYMMPMDWLVLLYFSIGVIEAKNWLFACTGWDKDTHAPAPNDDVVSRKLNYGSFASIALIFVLMGALPVFLEVLPPTRYAPVSKNDITKIIGTVPELTTTPAQTQISALLQEPGTRFEHGRALYPRYYPANQGESHLVNGPVLTNSYDFNRLTFYFIGTNSLLVILPITDIPADFSMDAEAWMIGCDRGTYVEALFVIQQENGATHLYQQSPPKMTCL